MKSNPIKTWRRITHCFWKTCHSNKIPFQTKNTPPQLMNWHPNTLKNNPSCGKITNVFYSRCSLKSKIWNTNCPKRLRIKILQTVTTLKNWKYLNRKITNWKRARWRWNTNAKNWTTTHWTSRLNLNPKPTTSSKWRVNSTVWKPITKMPSPKMKKSTTISLKNSNLCRMKIGQRMKRSIWPKLSHCNPS